MGTEVLAELGLAPVSTLQITTHLRENETNTASSGADEDIVTLPDAVRLADECHSRESDCRHAHSVLGVYVVGERGDLPPWGDGVLGK